MESLLLRTVLTIWARVVVHLAQRAQQVSHFVAALGIDGAGEVARRNGLGHPRRPECSRLVMRLVMARAMAALKPMATSSRMTVLLTAVE